MGVSLCRVVLDMRGGGGICSELGEGCAKFLWVMSSGYVISFTGACGIC